MTVAADRDFIDAWAVAELLGMARLTFLHRREALERDEGFPPPMPHLRRPLLWRKSQVRAWIEAQGRFAPEVRPADVGPGVVSIREAALMRKARSA